MPIKRVNAANIRAAAKFWKRNPGYGGFRQSLMYDVIIDGEPYPPKAIVSIAHELAKIGKMEPSSFKGTKNGPWHDLLRKLDFPIVPKGVVITEPKEIGGCATILTDIENIDDDPLHSSTDRATLIMARLGQGKYRKDLLALWDNQCAVTGCAVLPVLRASHAKPWRDSEDDERLNPNNGIPLVANLDALFDAGLIGFDENGDMHISKKLRDEELLNGVPRSLRKRPTIEQAYYLMEHLSSVFQTDDCFDF